MGKNKMNSIKYYICTILITVTAVVGFGIPKIPVYAASGSTTVYVTDTGKCYHSDGCSYLNKSKNKTTLEKAVGSGYKACSKCKPPKLDSSSTPKKGAPKDNSNDTMVWKSATGSCYHSKNNCGTMNPSKATQISESDAKSLGLKRCSKCW